MKTLLIALLLSAGICCADTVPNPRFTPGKADTTLTKQVICAPTFRTTTIRNVSEQTKTIVYYHYGVVNHAGYCTGKEGCEVDHLISLELGGSNDPLNLWPQPYTGEPNAHEKDLVENKLHSMVCSGQITLEQAQKQISTDWVGAYKKYVK
ncbi:HNHc domain containing protein [uncultured Caudovirales phage]|uniref:HNHc domain containing protein n=1 Tax=uncultured Caudovirales phage TaxID=2100421 RepID=A0A6J5LJ46_9CAUD|nr:HNHc domain containing protein [uncultured Caudovirales phage]